MARKTKAPEGETIEQLEARLADMKKTGAQPEKRSRGRPKVVSYKQTLQYKMSSYLRCITDSDVEGNANKGDLDTAGNTTSQTQDAHCERLALKVLVYHPSGRWEVVEPKLLVSTVRSRIATLKTDYQKHKKSLGETGFGLVMEDRAT
ncbi:hypothetical protein GGX14DRAFT_563031 [Mycena pura]|uniref:Uncharacterized protein n=1 Tax=Mycena pura TaxID=153505 RepID=A0AAD6VJU7_9AGAR|nr:hypothetical protein GGX14DRAFT_563031 [Mycena pura]